MVNWTAIVIVGIIAILLIIYTIRQNNKDRRKLEKNLKHTEKPTFDDDEYNAER